MDISDLRTYGTIPIKIYMIDLSSQINVENSSSFELKKKL